MMGSLTLPVFKHNGATYENIEYVNPGEWYGTAWLLSLTWGNFSKSYIVEGPEAKTAIEEFIVWCIENDGDAWIQPVDDLSDCEVKNSIVMNGYYLACDATIRQCKVVYTVDLYTTISKPVEDNNYEQDNEVLHNKAQYELYDIMRMLQDEGYMKRTDNDGTNWWETEPWMNTKGVYTRHTLHMTDEYGHPMCREHSVFEWLNKQIS